MGTVTKHIVLDALSEIVDPHTGLDLVTGKSVKDCELDGDDVSIDLVLGYPAKGWHSTLKELVVKALSKLENVESVEVRIETQVVAHEVQKGITPLKNVRNVIAVASGKGGVGKSTVSANLALALSAEGANVGLLDTDIYGPSQPRMLGVSGQVVPTADGEGIEPKNSFGIQTMSIGSVVDVDDTAIIWRGPMVNQALNSLLMDTRWDSLDYLILDLPPGTGDVQITLGQRLPVTCAVIVTTPQDIALLDARKALRAFEKFEVLVLGIIENMSSHICSSCGHEEHIFGKGGGRRMAEEYAIDYLGSIPLDITIRENSDNGTPTVVADPDSEPALIYSDIARKISGQLVKRNRDYSEVFPSIVIQND